MYFRPYLLSLQLQYFLHYTSPGPSRIYIWPSIPPLFHYHLYVLVWILEEYFDISEHEHSAIAGIILPRYAACLNGFEGAGTLFIALRQKPLQIPNGRLVGTVYRVEDDDDTLPVTASIFRA